MDTYEVSPGIHLEYAVIRARPTPNRNFSRRTLLLYFNVNLDMELVVPTHVVLFH